jgi:hypothetical protein
LGRNGQVSITNDQLDFFGIQNGQVMEQTLVKIETALKILQKDPWSADIKASDDFLNPLFKQFFQNLNLPNLINKTDYHVLASLLLPEEIDPEIIEKLDAIVQVAANVPAHFNLDSSV